MERCECFYALMSVAAFLALWMYKQDMLQVIGAWAIIGLIHVYLA